MQKKNRHFEQKIDTKNNNKMSRLAGGPQVASLNYLDFINLITWFFERYLLNTKFLVQTQPNRVLGRRLLWAT